MKPFQKINWKLAGQMSYWVVFAFLAVIAGATALTALGAPGGFRLYTVQSGSMSPSVPAGSVVLVRPATLAYREGDIITFKSEQDQLVENPELTTTHRIHEVRETEEGGLEYITKGDANNTPDGVPVKEDLVLGKVVFSVPLLGYPVSYARTRTGLIVLVIIPATLIIYSEFLNIKTEVVKIWRRRRGARA